MIREVLVEGMTSPSVVPMNHRRNPHQSKAAILLKLAKISASKKESKQKGPVMILLNPPLLDDATHVIPYSGSTPFTPILLVALRYSGFSKFKGPK